MFEANGGNTAQSELDVAIQASLATVESREKSELERAMERSLIETRSDADVVAASVKSLEEEQLARAMAASMHDSGLADYGLGLGYEIDPSTLSAIAAASGGTAAAATGAVGGGASDVGSALAATGMPSALRTVISMGYDELSVMTAYTVFESQGLSEEKLVENIIEYINAQRADLYGVGGDTGFF